MEGGELSSELSSFLNSGVYHLDGSSVVFVDPVRILNGSYTRFSLSPSAYYSRAFKSKSEAQLIEEVEEEAEDSSNSKKKKKRKRKRRASRDLNEREIAAEQRHKEIRSLLVNAHYALLQAEDLLRFIPNMVKGNEDSFCDEREEEHNFIELASHSHSSLYEISLCMDSRDTKGGEAQPDLGFNLIVIDPPWENGSVYQKAKYPTLPNRYFLYLPVKELAHKEGALVALWMTNREKLHMFVEKELFPAWGVTHVTVLYWLKVKPDGSLIGELDLFHHRPYESLLVGYVNTKGIGYESPPAFTYLQKNRVFISIPGAYSRKPPLESIHA